jgi:hypothetical protein
VSLYVTVEPDGPFIGDTSEDKLNHTVTQTIHYVLADGSEAAPDAVHTLAFKRTAQVNVETGAILSYGDWQAVTTDSFDAVVSPTLPNLFTTTKQIDATTVDGDTQDIVETVEYQDSVCDRETWAMVIQTIPTLGDTIEHNLIVDTIRTIKYVDESGKEVAQEYSTRLTFQRTAKVNVETNTVEEYTPWDPLTDTFPEVTSPAVENMFTTQKTLPAIPIKPGDADIPETVTYQDLYVTVNPEGPTYPAGVTKDDLNQSVTQTIHYVKADGSEAAPDHVVTLAFTRTAKYNVETGEVESYSDWTAVNGDTFATVVSPEVTDQFTTTKQIDAKTVKAMDDDITETVHYNDLYAVVQPDGPYTGETTKDLLNESVTATIHYLKADGSKAAADDVQILAFKRTATVNVETGKIVDYGDWTPVDGDTFKDVDSPIFADEFTTDKTVKGQKVVADAADIETYVQYQPKFVTVQPEGPDYPGESSQDLLNKTVTQTVHYVDVDGKAVADDHVATLDFTRTAKVDLETGKVVEWGTWQPKTTDTFVEVVSPNVDALTPDHKQIIPVKVAIEDPQDVETTVTYSNLYVTVPPEGPDYPGESSADKLNHTVTQIIHYVKADGSVAAPDSVKTLAFKRTAQVNVETGEILSFGDWEAVTTDTFEAVKSPDVPDQFTTTKQIDAVKVDGDSTDIVETVKYQDLFVTVNPDGPYVEGITKDDLNQTVTNTIHYVDENGDPVADDYTETLAFTRTATVNVETGEIVEKSDWQPVTTDTFADVTSPTIDDLFTTDKQIKGVQVKAEDANIETTVVYKELYLIVQPDGPDYPGNLSKEQLNETVMRTIHYVKADGSEASKDFVQTLHFTRTAKFNLETETVENFTDWVPVTSDTFSEVKSPDVEGQFTNKKFVVAETVKADSGDIEETVEYSDLIVTVKPDGPYIGDTNKELLNQSVTQTIHYVDVNGNTVNPDATKTLAFTRTASVNAETGEVISKSDWEPVTTDTFEEVSSPILDGLFTETKQINAVKVDAEQADIVENVVYKDLFMTVNPDGPYVEGVTNEDLNQTVTNIIHYVDANGNPIADDYTETLAFTRTATVNVETGEIVEMGEWQPVTTNTFADVTSPVLDNLFTTEKQVKGVQVKAEDEDLETTVTYNDLYLVVQPEGPDYPAGTSKADLNEAVTQTIHYVDENGNQVSPDVTKTLNFTRTATINVETGEVVSHTDWQATTTDTFDKVVSPEIADLFTKQKAIDEVTVNADADDITENVVYQQLIVTVQPDGPYIGDTTEDLLNQTVTQTIHYVDADGKPLASDYTATVTFKRTATVNAETGEILEFGAWTPASDTFAAVPNPTLKGYTTDSQAVSAQTVTFASDDLVTTVIYTAATTPKPTPTPDQGTPTPTPNNTQQIGPAVITPANAGTTASQMPPTSDAQNTKLSLLGMILASFATVGAWFTTRKQKKGARH